MLTGVSMPRATRSRRYELRNHWLASTSMRVRVLDDLNDDGPEGDILIGNDGAGGEIPSIHVQEGESQANPLQIFRG